MFVNNPKARKYFTLVTPETILYRWKRAIKDYWTYDKPKTRKKGRPPITKTLKLMIKNMKIDNYLWGSKRIQGELEKISIIPDDPPKVVARTQITSKSTPEDAFGEYMRQVVPAKLADEIRKEGQQILKDIEKAQ